MCPIITLLIFMKNCQNKSVTNDTCATLSKIQLNKKSLDNIYYILNIEDKIRYLNTTVLELFDYHAPFKTSFISKPYAPWLTPSIKELMKQRNRALSLYKQTKSAQHWLFYKQLRNSTVAALKREEKTYLDYESNTSNKKRLWVALKKLNIQKKVKGCDLSTFSADEINEYFLSVFTPPQNCVEAANNI